MRITFAVLVLSNIAVFCQIQSSKAFPILVQRVADPVHSGESYITTVTVIGSLIVLLFAAKWVYVSRRQRKQRMRSRKFASMWRDDFSSSSVHVWRKGSSNKGKPVKSAFLVGLFGSPSWETRYSAIVDKVSGSQFQSLRQDFGAPGGSVRSKSASEKSDRPSPVSSPNFKSMSGVNRVNSIIMHRLDSTRPKSLSESTDILVPSPVLGSTDYLSWKKNFSKNLLSGKHASYPTGLCIESGIGSWSFKTKTPVAFLPSVSSGSHTMESFSSQISAQDKPQDQNSQVLVEDNAYFGKLESSADLSWRSTPAPKDPPRLSIEYALINDSPHSQNYTPCSLYAHPYSQTPGRPLILDMDLEQSKITPSLDLEPPHVDPCHSCHLSSITLSSAKLQPRISPPRDQGRSRSRRSSPKVGPSPLRRMFIPSDDLTNEEPEIPSSPMVEEEDIASDVHRQSYSTINSIQSSQTAQIQPVCASEVRSARKTRPSIGKLTMSDNLLDFLDELVQETSEWDASLFIDDNFKAMIDHSKSSDISPSTQMNHIKRSTFSRKQRVSFTLLEGIPEVDVTEFSPPESEVVLNHSYWTDEDESHREAVGIAH